MNTIKLIYTAILFASLASTLALGADDQSKPPAAPLPSTATTSSDPLSAVRADMAIAQRDYFVAAKDEADAKSRQATLTQILMSKYSQAQTLCTEAKLGNFDPASLKCQPATPPPTSAATGASSALPPAAPVPHPPAPPITPTKSAPVKPVDK